MCFASQSSQGCTSIGHPCCFFYHIFSFYSIFHYYAWIQHSEKPATLAMTSSVLPSLWRVSMTVLWTTIKSEVFPITAPLCLSLCHCFSSRCVGQRGRIAGVVFLSLLMVLAHLGPQCCFKKPSVSLSLSYLRHPPGCSAFGLCCYIIHFKYIYIPTHALTLITDYTPHF